jgi:hypothetical protein
MSGKLEIPKIEIRNKCQWRNSKVLHWFVSNLVIWIWVFVSDFDIRISDYPVR